jgi:S1/P1 Nuclease
MKKLYALLLLLVVAPPALAWNDVGHLVVARLAWLQLSKEQQAQITAVLRKHPHYEEYLITKKPTGFSEDEWVFMHAATWPDWVRNHEAREFSHATWHYVNYPFVPPGSKIDPAKHEPPPRQENVVNVLPRCVERIRAGGDIDKAVYLCWLLHLIGDMHQPLHCVAMYSEQFPTGDAGGNSCRIRIKSGGSPVNLHSYWDGLLGRGQTAGSIGKDVQEVEEAMRVNEATIQADLKAHQTFETWAREGAELAKTAVYLHGELPVVKGSSSRGRGKQGDEADVREAPADYGHNSGRVARVQIGKAGTRLAGELKQLFR